MQDSWEICGFEESLTPERFELHTIFATEKCFLSHKAFAPTAYSSFNHGTGYGHKDRKI